MAIPQGLRKSWHPVDTTVQLASSWKAELYYRKEVTTVNYATPKLTALKPAINAIQTVTPSKEVGDIEDNHFQTLPSACYEDGE
jgi:hypothetical protein